MKKEKKKLSHVLVYEDVMKVRSLEFQLLCINCSVNRPMQVTVYMQDIEHLFLPILIG